MFAVSFRRALLARRLHVPAALLLAVAVLFTDAARAQAAQPQVLRCDHTDFNVGMTSRVAEMFCERGLMGSIDTCVLSMAWSLALACRVQIPTPRLVECGARITGNLVTSTGAKQARDWAGTVRQLVTLEGSPPQGTIDLVFDVHDVMAEISDVAVAASSCRILGPE